MVNDPQITVTCDRCGEEDSFEMCSLAGGGWDLRNLPRQLQRAYWHAPNGVDGETYCGDCKEDIVKQEHSG